jgi:trehalose synthase
VSGFLVDSVEQAAARIVHVVKGKDLRARIGAEARESVAQRFLMTRLMEDWLDLIRAFEVQFRLKGGRKGEWLPSWASAG